MSDTGSKHALPGRPGLNILWLVIPVIVILSIWWPVFRQYDTDAAEITPEIVAEAVSAPADSVLKEITQLSFVVRFTSDDKLLQTADEILEGRLQIPLSGFDPIHIDPAFSEDDLISGPPEVRLYMAGLHVPDVLIDSYRLTGKRRYLDAATTWLENYARFELGLRLPHGLVFNAHATANRGTVLAKYWLAARGDSDIDGGTRELILKLADNTRHLLAAPSRYVANSNYGIIQPVALCCLAVAFPTLPDQDSFVDTAVSRLQAKMPSYLNSEGVVLEHSPGYHRDGLQFLALGLRALWLLDRPIPDDWLVRYHKGVRHLQVLQRPDLSLPRIGDTEDAIDPEGPWMVDVDEAGHVGSLRRVGTERTVADCRETPIAGYSLWWQRDTLSQVALTWSYFRGHAHKHADELSLTWWVRGQDWITNTGYPAYGTKHRVPGLGWRASNAPHLTGEQYRSERQSLGLVSLCDDSTRFIDLIRRGPGRFEVRRQVLQMGPSLLIVLDLARGAKDDSITTVWTTAAAHCLSADNKSRSWTVRSSDDSTVMLVALAREGQSKVRKISGQMNPYGGWQIIHCHPIPAPAIEVSALAEGYRALIAFSLEDTGALAGAEPLAARIENMSSPENWELSVSRQGQTIDMMRNRNELVVSASGQGPQRYELEPADTGGIMAARETIGHSFASLIERFPKFRDRMAEREKATWFLPIVLIVSEILLRGLYRRRYYRLHMVGRIATQSCWLAGGWWLWVYYLNPYRPWTGL